MEYSNGAVDLWNVEGKRYLENLSLEEGEQVKRSMHSLQQRVGPCLLKQTEGGITVHPLPDSAPETIGLIQKREASIQRSDLLQLGNASLLLCSHASGEVRIWNITEGSCFQIGGEAARAPDVQWIVGSCYPTFVYRTNHSLQVWSNTG